MKSSSRSREMKALRGQAGQNVDVAQSNARSAQVPVKNRLTTQGIFMVQQSMEGATKAFAAANGADYKDVPRQGHQNLRLMMMTLDHIVRRTGKSDYVNHMVGGRYFKVDDYDVENNWLAQWRLRRTTRRLMLRRVGRPTNCMSRPLLRLPGRLSVLFGCSISRIQC